MAYDVQLINLPVRFIAAVEARFTLPELPTICPRVIGEAWTFVRNRPEIDTGRNVAYYLNDAPGPFGVTLSTGRFGMEVAVPFEGDGHVMCFKMPACRAVWTEHYGSYLGLNKPHEAILAWLQAHPDVTHSGPFWEIYGHWTSDTEKLSTQVFYGLKGSGSEDFGLESD